MQQPISPPHKSGVKEPMPPPQEFPYLDMSSLSEIDRSLLESKLRSETNKMVRAFSAFSIYVQRAVRSEQVLVEELASCVLSLEGFSYGRMSQKHLTKTDEEAIEQAKSIGGIFLKLRHYTSFFNYEIIEAYCS